jgi:aspartate ammonia-lyase
LELNTHMPLIAANLVKSFNLMIGTLTMVDEKCVRGIVADEARCRHYFETSAGLATILNPILGYDRVATLVKEGLAGGKTLTQLVVEKNLMAKETLEHLLAGAFGPNRRKTQSADDPAVP